MKFLFILTLGLSLNAFAQEDTDCIPTQDFEVIANHFTQWKSLIDASKTEYCTADMETETFEIIRSINYLKNVNPRHPEYDANDALTYKSIDEQNWWGYFINRASSIQIDNSCPAGVAAYVYPFFKGQVYVCEGFFEQEIPAQASIMLHEVRHFEGHGHVTCSQGSEKGNSGACDEDILDQGSYAVSVQSTVAFARSNQTSDELRASLESEAIYYGHNKFNIVPELKIDNYIILSSESGEIIDWNLNSDELNLVKTYPSGGMRLFNSYNKITVFPTDVNVPAFRTDNGFKADHKSIGMFAEFYNAIPVEKRNLFTSVVYEGTGGFIYDNQLYTLCDNRSFKTDNLSEFGNVENLVSFKIAGEERSFMVHSDGTLTEFECANLGSSQNLSLSTPEFKLDESLKGLKYLFSVSGTEFAVTADGALAILIFDGALLTIDERLSTPNQDGYIWTSATSSSKARIFNN